MLKNPCGKSCPMREIGCAATCESWQAYVKERNAAYDARCKAKDAEYDVQYRAILREINRNKRWKKR